jgi:hypothetical protein
LFNRIKPSNLTNLMKGNTMNTRTYSEPTENTANERFTPAHLPTATPHRLTVEADLEQLKNRLLREELTRAATLEMNVHLRRAANDAAALAWLTPYPLLVLPGLFDEKALIARKQAARAGSIRARSAELLALSE